MQKADNTSISSGSEGQVPPDTKKPRIVADIVLMKHQVVTVKIEPYPKRGFFAECCAIARCCCKSSSVKMEALHVFRQYTQALQAWKRTVAEGKRAQAEVKARGSFRKCWAGLMKILCCCFSCCGGPGVERARHEAREWMRSSLAVTTPEEAVATPAGAKGGKGVQAMFRMRTISRPEVDCRISVAFVTFHTPVRGAAGPGGTPRSPRAHTHTHTAQAASNAVDGGVARFGGPPPLRSALTLPRLLSCWYTDTLPMRICLAPPLSRRTMQSASWRHTTTSRITSR